MTVCDLEHSDEGTNAKWKREMQKSNGKCKMQNAKGEQDKQNKKCKRRTGNGKCKNEKCEKENANVFSATIAAEKGVSAATNEAP